jgi:hypothetical protein
MPIEIRELVIKATVGENSQQSGGSAEKPSKMKDELLQEAVDQVLEIIKRKKER